MWRNSSQAAILRDRWEESSCEPAASRRCYAQAQSKGDQTSTGATVQCDSILAPHAYLAYDA